MPTKAEAKKMDLGQIIEKMMNEGKPQKQSIAIAYSLKGKSKKKSQ